jgi:NitT/TauT family transport system ATP-binding protein
VSAPEAEIVFDAVSKQFPDGDAAATFAVRDLSFAVQTGELVAVLGKTGCGKSTMFNLLAGLILPSAGKVLVKGHDPYRQFDWFRGKVGIVFQTDRLMPWRTALDNAAYGLELNGVAREQRTAIAARWLARLGLGGREHDYPHALSGGMRQRVSIARAFAIEPEILLCDEPFSALDEVTGNSLRREFLQLIRETKATGIFITHSIDEALELGQRVLVFHRPARIAYAAALPESLSVAERRDIRDAILRALSAENA